MATKVIRKKKKRKINILKLIKNNLELYGIFMSVFNEEAKGPPKMEASFGYGPNGEIGIVYKYK